MQRRKMLGMLSAAAGSTILGEPLLRSQQTSTASDQTSKESVTGVGGFFFRAHDPRALAQWYQEHLGVLITPQKAGDPVWTQQAGPTSFTPFPEKTTYFGDAAKQWMINFRVGNLERMAAQLQASGIAVTVDPPPYPYGRFAHLHDPEGNTIELWQPATKGSE